ncbi:unnamed protein product [Chilo suppressalis]|uniref:Uncharacterized protein n=1 Tax=Chilo suppressalis TaxID=168631 RepID=A0ABN8BB07_CHISP|nr:unnamed protein product [Chilo suppressalis]
MAFPPQLTEPRPPLPGLPRAPAERLLGFIMPYKIVSTIEKGKSVLTAVTSAWENDGRLFWPLLSAIKVDKLRRIEHSEPEKDRTILNCIVKRRNMNTFDRAELEIENMCYNSDSELDNDKTKRPGINKNTHEIFLMIVQNPLNIWLPLP